jgi:hypothetical protein
LLLFQSLFLLSEKECFEFQILFECAPSMKIVVFRRCKICCNQKREGAIPNNILTVRANLSDLVFFDLFCQDTTSDLFLILPHWFFLCTFYDQKHTLLLLIQISKIEFCCNQRLPLTFTKMPTSTSFPTAEYSSKCRLPKIAQKHKLPDYKMFIKDQTPIEV